MIRFVLILFILILFFDVDVAFARSPLPRNGNASLFEMVLSRPGTWIHKKPGGDQGEALQPLAILYVYGRKLHGEEEWVQVGTDTTGSISGWVPAGGLVPWKQTLVLGLKTAVVRDPVMFFRDATEVKRIAGMSKESDRNSAVQDILKRIDRGQINELPVIATAPELPPNNNYLMPILDLEHFTTKNDGEIKLLEVAVISPKRKIPNPCVKENDGNSFSDIFGSFSSFKGTGNYSQDRHGCLPQMVYRIAFVIDTTTSMGPFIDTTRRIVSQITKSLREIPEVGEHLLFALVGYRDNKQDLDNLEYTAKVFMNFTPGSDAASFDQAIAKMTPSSVSTIDVREDVVAGLDKAIEQLDWGSNEGFNLIYLITDASGREQNDSRSTTRQSIETIRSKADSRKIFLSTIHMINPRWLDDAPLAKAQYKDILSNYQSRPDSTRSTDSVEYASLYFSVDLTKDDEHAFLETMKNTMRAIMKSFAKSMKGEVEPPPNIESDDDLETRFLKSLSLASRFAQLEFVGRMEDTSAPSLHKAWISDHDLHKQDLAVVDVRVLLTRNQLNDLAAAIKALYEKAEEKPETHEDFFENILTNLAGATYDPSMLNSDRLEDIRDLGTLTKLLEQLPYQSRLMAMNNEAWIDLGFEGQEEFIFHLYDLHERYQDFANDSGNWLHLREDEPGGGDDLYPVPLTDLP